MPKNYAEINSTKPPLDVNSMPKPIEMRPTKLNLHKHYGIQCDDKEWKQDQLRHVNVHLLAIIKYMLSFYGVKNIFLNKQCLTYTAYKTTDIIIIHVVRGLYKLEFLLQVTFSSDVGIESLK